MTSLRGDQTPVTGGILERLAVVEDRQREHGAKLDTGAATFGRLRAAGWALVCALAVSVGASLVGYGRLMERVDTLRELLTEVRDEQRASRRP